MASIISSWKTALATSPLYSSRPCNHQLCSYSIISSGSNRISGRISLHSCHQFQVSVVPSGEASSSLVTFEELVENDWSFVDECDDYGENISCIINAGAITKESRVLVSIGSEGFTDHIMETTTTPSHLLIVHDSLFVLACIKEKHDQVKCWQGKLIEVPEKWGSFDSVFLNFLPAMGLKLDQVFSTLAYLCSNGSKVIISHPGGRRLLEEQREQHKDLITSDLPDEETLQITAAKHKFEVIEFVDNLGLYKAVVQFSG